MAAKEVATVSSLFPSWTNAVPAAVLAGLTFTGIGVAAGVWYYFTPEYWRVGYEPEQPVAFSHARHAGELGIDCRYCHSNIERSGHANVPDTATCMNCHTGDGDEAFFKPTVWERHKENISLVRLRESWASGEPVQWKRVHKVPDYAHFDHSVHLNAGVSCYACHGRVDRLKEVRQEHSMSMGWCLECHRSPEKYLVDVDGLLGEPVRLTDLATVEAQLKSRDQLEMGRKLVEMRKIDPPEHCGACHY
jgi:hypothetical protein